MGWTDTTKSELAIKLVSSPTDNKANNELVVLLAKQLGIAKRAISIKRGHTSRHKLLKLDILQSELDAFLELY